MGQQKQPLFRFHVFVHVYAEVLLDLFVLKVFFFVFFKLYVLSRTAGLAYWVERLTCVLQGSCRGLGSNLPQGFLLCVFLPVSLTSAVQSHAKSLNTGHFSYIFMYNSGFVDINGMLLS